MELINNYTATEIGLIPIDWDVKQIGEFTEVVAGGTPSTKIKDYWGGDIRWMNSGELNFKIVIDVQNRITNDGLKNSSTRVVPKFCTLVGLAGQGKTRGTAAYNVVELCTNQSIAAIFPGKNHNPKFLYFYIDSKYLDLRNISTGDGGRGGLNLSLIKSLFVPFPPLPEQRAIAEVLSDTDNLIQSLEKQISKKRLIKQGAMQKLLSPKEGWEERQLKDCLLENPKYGIGAPAVNYDANLPTYLRITDISDDGTIIREDLKSVDHPNSKDYFLKTGDLVFARTGASVGKSYLYDGKDGAFVYAGFLIKITPNPKLLNSFFLKSFVSTKPYWNWVLTTSMRSGQPGINGNEYGNLKIFVPEIIEQNRIAEILSDMDAEIIGLQMQREKYKYLKKGLMQSLLTGRIRLK